jgi:uncharacterized phage protein (TIGR02218 family)
MRRCTDAVRHLLENWYPPFVNSICDLYSFHLVGGEVLRYADWQIQLEAPAPETDGPKLIFPVGPRLKRNKTKYEVGVSVDELEVEVYAEPGDLVLSAGALTWQQALHYGIFDGAYLDLWRCFMVNNSQPVGTVQWFYGRVADVEVGRTRSIVHVKSLLDLLTAQMPRRLFQAGCTHIFGDAMCGFDRSSRRADITSAGGGQSRIDCGLTPDPPTLYDGGTIIGTSGPNAGFQRTISRLVGGSVYVLDPYIFPITPGETFELLPGCDHTLATCQNVFDNLARFGGFPYIPPPESAA